jgi:hypothetical protein
VKNHSKLSQPLPDLTFWINQVSSMVPLTGAKKSLKSSFFLAVKTKYADIRPDSRLFFQFYKFVTYPENNCVLHDRINPAAHLTLGSYHHHIQAVSIRPHA